MEEERLAAFPSSTPSRCFLFKEEEEIGSDKTKISKL
jgi:hypothetical protein